MKDVKIGFIGGGNMAGALIAGIVNSGSIAPENITVSDLDQSKLDALGKLGVNTTTSNEEAEEKSEILFLAVKPNIMPVCLDGLKSFEDKIYVSIAAGITLEFLESRLGADRKIVRTMPNTPALVGCGMTVITPNSNLSADEAELVENILKSVGETVRLEEKYMNAAIALHSSSPAYIFMLIDAMADAGVKYGLTKAQALKLAAKAVEGSAKMTLESAEHPMKLKDNVCSPGGTTIAAVCELERNGFRADIQSAIDACVDKAESMSK